MVRLSPVGPISPTKRGWGDKLINSQQPDSIRKLQNRARLSAYPANEKMTRLRGRRRKDSANYGKLSIIKYAMGNQLQMPQASTLGSLDWWWG